MKTRVSLSLIVLRTPPSRRPRKWLALRDEVETSEAQACVNGQYMKWPKGAERSADHVAEGGNLP
jgi:hypothetical protein